MRALGSFAFGCVCAAFVQPACADVQPALAHAIDDLSHERSYHLTIAMRGETIESDVLNPGGFHTVTNNREQYVIGSTMYLKIQGRWTKAQGTGGTSDVLARLRERHADYTSRDLGRKPVNGASCEAYAVVDARRPAARETVYVDSAGRIVRMDVGDSVMTFSRFGEPVTLRPPI